MKDNILREIAEILDELFDVNVDDIVASTTADEVDGWDSMSHLEVIGKVESHFKIKFVTAELLRYKTVGEMSEGVRSLAGA